MSVKDIEKQLKEIFVNTIHVIPFPNGTDVDYSQAIEKARIALQEAWDKGYQEGARVQAEMDANLISKAKLTQSDKII